MSGSRNNRDPTPGPSSRRPRGSTPGSSSGHNRASIAGSNSGRRQPGPDNGTAATQADHGDPGTHRRGRKPADRETNAGATRLSSGSRRANPPQDDRSSTQTYDATHPRRFGNLGLLAPEIRRNIYSFLLNGIETEYQPGTRTAPGFSNDYHRYSNRAHGYEWHTEVVRYTNTSIAREALDYVQSENLFVLIGLHGRGLVRDLHMANVPIVTDSRRLRTNYDRPDQAQYRCFPHWSVYLEIRHEDPWWTHQFDSVKPIDTEPVLMLWRDLPYLYEMMKFISGYATPRWPLVISSRHARPLELRPKPGALYKHAESPSLEVVLRDNLHGPRESRYKSIREPQEKFLAQQILTMPGFGYAMRDQPMGPGRVWKNIRQRMSPPFIWARAKECDMIERLEQKKAQIENYIRDDDLQAAYDRLDYLWDYFAEIGHIMYTNDLANAVSDPGNMTDPSREKLYVRGQRLVNDLTLTWARLILRRAKTRSNHSDYASEMTLAFDALDDIWPDNLNGELEFLKRHLWLLHTLYRIYYFDNFDAFTDLQTQAQALRTNPRMTTASSLVRGDIEVVAEYVQSVQQNGRPSKAVEQTFLERLSPQTEIYIYRSNIQDNIPENVDDFRRWQDNSHKALLSDAAKNFIRTWDGLGESQKIHEHEFKVETETDDEEWVKSFF